MSWGANKAQSSISSCRGCLASASRAPAVDFEAVQSEMTNVSVGEYHAMKTSSSLTLSFLRKQRSGQMLSSLQTISTLEWLSHFWSAFMLFSLNCLSSSLSGLCDYSISSRFHWIPTMFIAFSSWTAGKLSRPGMAFCQHCDRMLQLSRWIHDFFLITVVLCL
jgi:hypothetical protein